MRAVSISRGVDMERIARAAAAEIESYSRSGGDPADAFLVVSVRVCRDEEKKTGPSPDEGPDPVNVMDRFI